MKTCEKTVFFLLPPGSSQHSALHVSTAALSSVNLENFATQLAPLHYDILVWTRVCHAVVSTMVGRRLPIQEPFALLHCLWSFHWLHPFHDFHGLVGLHGLCDFHGFHHCHDSQSDSANGKCDWTKWLSLRLRASKVRSSRACKLHCTVALCIALHNRFIIYISLITLTLVCLILYPPHECPHTLAGLERVGQPAIRGESSTWPAGRWLRFS